MLALVSVVLSTSVIHDVYMDSTDFLSSKGIYTEHMLPGDELHVFGEYCPSAGTMWYHNVNNTINMLIHTLPR